MIKVSELTKYYGDRKAVGPLSFRIETGEVIGLLGLNGAGKTTTLRMLSTDLLPTSGRMLVDNVDLGENPEQIRSKIGYLPDKPPLYLEMSVTEYLYFAAELRGMLAVNIPRRVDEVVELTDLGSECKTRIGALSHGYRQRVGIAQAIVHRPKLLLLDEPISGLDPVQIVEMRELIRSLRGEHTTILSSHILSEISETCDRLLVIQDGEIIASGSEDQLTGQLAAGLATQITMRLPESMRGDDPAEAFRSLTEGIDAITDVEEVTAERGDGVVAVVVQFDEDVREQICNKLVSGGVGLLAVERRAASELEGVFLKLTGQAPSYEA